MIAETAKTSASPSGGFLRQRLNSLEQMVNFHSRQLTEEANPAESVAAFHSATVRNGNRRQSGEAIGDTQLRRQSGTPSYRIDCSRFASAWAGVGIGASQFLVVPRGPVKRSEQTQAALVWMRCCALGRICVRQRDPAARSASA